MRLGLGNTLVDNGLSNPDLLSLDLQFAADKTLAARRGPTPAFTRANPTATFVGSDGLIQTATTDIARFDHDPVSPFTCKGLLIEDSRTNLLQRSSEFDNVYWDRFNVSISPNDQTSPDGSLNADTFTASAGTPSLYKPVTCTASTSYTFSFYIKLGTLAASDFKFAVRDDTGGAFIAENIVPNITPVTTEWRRVTYTFTTPVGCVLVRPYICRFSYATTGTFYVWGAQLEAGSFATSYIPTTTSTGVRSADVCSISGDAFSGFYNQSEGTIFSSAMIANLVGVNRGIVQIDSGGTVHQFRQVYGFSDGGFRNLVSANDTATQLGSSAGAASTIQKLALSFSGTSFAGTVNGAAVTSATRTAPVGVNILRVGGITSSSLFLNGHIQAIRYFKKRLTNAKLQTLTT
jgi:hypothetical protein